jgi:hypothetical protein
MRELQCHYAGSKHEYLFVDSFSEITYRVPKRQSKITTGTGGLIHNAVGYILDELDALCQNAPDHIVHSLTLYMDMFIPILDCPHLNDDTKMCTDNGNGAPIEKLMPNKCFHSGLLPNNVSKLMQCSFWSDSGKLEPIVHLLSKSTPQRCQIRSLSHIVYNYSRLHDNVYEFLVKCLQCSLMGAYKGVQRPPFEIRRKLHKVFAELDKHTFLQWMKNSHQQLLFFTIKEYLVFAAKCLPALRLELIERYNWSQFEKTVTKAMDRVRLENTDMRFEGAEAMLLTVNKSQTNLYRPIKHPFVYFILQEFEREDDVNHVEESNVEQEYVDMFYQMLIRIPRGPVPFEWLYIFGADQQICTKIKQIKKQMQADGIKLALRKFIQSLTKTVSMGLRCLSIAYDMHNNIRMFTLPVHITVEQIRALRQLYNVPDGEEAPEMGKSLVCTQCKKFKGFVVHVKKKPINLFAYGHSKVLINYETGKMHCGRRCDKVDKKRETNAEFESIEVTEAKDNKRTAKEHRKNIKNKLCAKTELIEVPLLGNILQFYGALYTVCPQCGRFMKYNPNKMYDGMYCGCCIKDGKRINEIQCARCGDRQHLGDPIMVSSGESIYLCKQHYKPWIREANSVLDKETILRGLEEKWKRLQSI